MRTMVAVAVLAATLALAATASAHVTLQPEEAPAGGFTRLDVRVPNERDDAGTTKVEVRVPARIRVRLDRAGRGLDRQGHEAKARQADRGRGRAA